MTKIIRDHGHEVADDAASTLPAPSGGDFPLTDDVDADGYTIQNLADPVDDGDAVPKSYADALPAPSLTAVLAEGADTGAVPVTGTYGTLDLGLDGAAELKGKNGTGDDPGTEAFVRAGGDAHGGSGAMIDLLPADGAGAHGGAMVRSFGTAGGNYQVAAAIDGLLHWSDLIVIDGDAPPEIFAGLLWFDSTPATGGLYAWDGAAYVQIAATPA